jgi:hypothetical protein
MRTLALISLLLAGCASPLTESQCRGSNWYDRGYQDAMMGLRPGIDLYAYQCGTYQVQVPEQQYMDGWKIGYSEWNVRVSGARM